MIMRFRAIDEPFEISDEYVTYICIENKAYYSQILFSLYNIIEYNIESDEIKLFEDEKLNISKVARLIVDVLSYDINNRLIQGKLYKKIEQMIIADEAVSYNIQSISNNLYTLFSELFLDIDTDLECKTSIEVKEFIKLFSVSFAEKNFNSIFDKVIGIIDIFAYLNDNTVIFFSNLSHFIPDDKIKEICKYATYKKVKVVLLEQGSEIIDKEYCKLYYIDNDYDVFEK